MKKILYFTASWCQPCQSFGPVVEEVQREGINVQKINIEEDKSTTSRYQVRSVPTCIYLKDGIEIARRTGVDSKQTIMRTYNLI